MRKIFMFLAGGVIALVLATNALALPQYPADVEKRLNLGDVRSSAVQLGYQVVSNKIQLLKCKYDYSTQGGGSSAAIRLKAVDGSYCVLPSNAIVFGGLIDVLTAPTSLGAGAQISVSTGATTADLKAATAKASFTGKLDVIPVETAATAIKLSAAKNPSMSVTNFPLSAGKFNVFIEYLLSDS